jgi:hypothetical protein
MRFGKPVPRIGGSMLRARVIGSVDIPRGVPSRDWTPKPPTPSVAAPSRSARSVARLAFTCTRQPRTFVQRGPHRGGRSLRRSDWRPDTGHSREASGSSASGCLVSAPRAGEGRRVREGGPHGPGRTLSRAPMPRRRSPRPCDNPAVVRTAMETWIAGQGACPLRKRCMFRRCPADAFQCDLRAPAGSLWPSLTRWFASSRSGLDG